MLFIGNYISYLEFLNLSYSVKSFIWFQVDFIVFLIINFLHNVFLLGEYTEIYRNIQEYTEVLLRTYNLKSWHYNVLIINIWNSRNYDINMQK